MGLFLRSRFFWVFPFASWAVLLGASLLFSMSELGDVARNLAYERGQSMFNLVQMTRLWNAQHGGVYVPVTDETRPNPYLDVPDRDVVTIDSVVLTKMNPAFMTRKIAAVARENSGILFHLTSLKPINPGNSADAWETWALESFEDGVQEVLHLTKTEDKQQYRFMGPLLTKRACLKCHRKQGYREGDIRGGLSITLNAAPFLAAQQAGENRVVWIHVLAFVLLTSSTIFLLHRLRRQWRLVNETQETLAKREQFLSRITDNTREGIIAMDRDGTLTFINPEAKRLLGWSRQDAADTNLVRLLEGGRTAKGDSHASEIERCLAGEGVFRVHRSQFPHPERGSIPVTYVVAPLTEGNNIIGAVLAFDDISAQLEFERRAVRSETMSALGEMVAGIAHEVKTPVGVAVTASSYLAGQLTKVDRDMQFGTLRKSGLQSFLHNARESSELVSRNLLRASELVTKFKQVAADQTSQTKQQFELGKYLNDVISTLSPQLKKTSISVDVEHPFPVPMNSYPGAVSQVVTNLIMNSLTHAFPNESGGRLRFQVAGDAHKATLIYTDDGKGIKPQELERVFKPFFTTRRGAGNTGLGLHISYNLVTEVLRGQISLQSTPGQGVRFLIEMPVDPSTVANP